jgi:hypothetical protein
LSATAAGAITGAGGIGGTTSTTLTAASVGVIPNQTGIGTTPLTLTGAGPLTITASGATATDGISVQSAGSILLGSVTANGGGGRAIVLDSINGQLNGTGAAPQIVGGKVILLAHTLADIGFPGSLRVISSAPPVLCGASAGGAAGAASCAFPSNVNNSFAAFAANLNLQTSNLQSGIVANLTTTLTGPAQLLSSGILPEEIFLTAECHVEDKKGREEDPNRYQDDENKLCVKTLLAQAGGNRGSSGVVIVAP